jgi:hypothetical protein
LCGHFTRAAPEWSVELGCLEKLCSVDREDTSRQGLVFAPDLQHDFTARRAACPDLAPQASEACYRILSHREDPVTRPQSGLSRGTVLSKAGDDYRILDFLGIETEPGTGRTVRASIG